MTLTTFQSSLSMSTGSEFDKITIFTVDGTGSTDPYHTDPNMTGGFPARVAKLLDPTKFRWVAIDYPAAPYPMGDSVDTGVETLIGLIGMNPGPVVLSGLSQGALVCSKVYNEFRYGRLKHRRYDLVAGVMFGNPAREPGHTINLPGATDPGGGGIQNFNIQQSYGTVNGILSDSEPLWWEFANPGDPACTTPSGTTSDQIARMFSFLYHGFDKTGTEGLLNAIANLFANPQQTWDALKQLDLIPGASTVVNPHIRYHELYTPLTGNTTKSAVDLAVDYLNTVYTATKASPPPPPGKPMIDKLNTIENYVDDWRTQLNFMRKAKPMITFYRNRSDGEAGLEYYGRVSYQDTIRASFPFKKNVSAQGIMELRFDHYISEWLRSIPNDPNHKKNIVIRVDMFGGKLRWTGLMHHHAVKMRDGIHYMELTFNDDLQFLQFLLAPPNPILPIPVFQFPRVFTLLGPAKWACSTLILINLIRVQGLINLPNDPFDPDDWGDVLGDPWGDWQVHIKANPLPFDDSSLWTVLGSRMNPVDSVLSDALSDAQLTLRWRRVFTDEGESETGLLFNTTPANGALVYQIVDDSGYYSPLTGTFLGGSIIDGMIRSVVQYVGGFVEDTGLMITDDETLYPDEYYGPGFLSTLASAPWLVIRDNSWTPMETAELTWSPATAVRVIVGGDNPAADAIARLIIETTGNILGYFLLGGFSSAGTIAADVVMPFLVGTIAAWLEWKNVSRANNLGWVHLWELYQQGAENNSWSLSAIAALRGGFLATRSETSHTMSLRGNSWIVPGVHFQIGSRIGSTCRGYDNIIFVNQVEEIIPSWDHSGSGEGVLNFQIKAGENKASMSTGERVARLVKKTRDILNNIGVHLVS